MGREQLLYERDLLVAKLSYVFRITDCFDLSFGCGRNNASPNRMLERDTTGVAATLLTPEGKRDRHKSCVLLCVRRSGNEQ